MSAGSREAGGRLYPTQQKNCRFCRTFTGATGLEPATSGVTGRLRSAAIRQSLCGRRVVDLMPTSATAPKGRFEVAPRWSASADLGRPPRAASAAARPPPRPLEPDPLEQANRGRVVSRAARDDGAHVSLVESPLDEGADRFGRVAATAVRNDAVPDLDRSLAPGGPMKPASPTTVPELRSIRTQTP
jgi:hypothetical protein